MCSVTRDSQCDQKTIDIQTAHTLSVNLPIVTLTHIPKGLLQKKDVNLVVVNSHQRELKYVKNVSCVTQSSFVKPVTNVPAVALDLPVGTRLHKFIGKLGKLWVPV